MKKSIYLILLFVMPILLSANVINGDGDDKKKRKKKGKKTEIRAERQIALTLDGGWNTVGANGILASYYVNPRVGIDLGVGLGIKGGKLGVRGKYMLSTKNFAPFVGLGLSARFFNVEGIEGTNTNSNGDFESITYDSNNALYIQPTIGFEYMSNGGFVIGLATGYSIVANDPYTVTAGESKDIESGLDFLWGNGLILSFNIGYAF